jgi:hypothetical protein
MQDVLDRSFWKQKRPFKMRENPVISDWVHVSGGNTEGLLGGWLAQRQAALRGLLAAGARSTLRLFVSVRAGLP